MTTEHALGSSTTKSALRHALRAERDALPTDVRAGLCAQAAEHLETLCEWQEAKVIASFMPYQSEFDPMMLLSHAAATTVTMVYPRVVDSTLHFHEWRSGQAFITNKMGVREPAAEAREFRLDQIDLFITPLLACSDTGHRLGYGGGFYDRVFAQSIGFRLGVGFHFQRVNGWVTEMHDLQIDAFLCETGLERFQPTDR